MLDKMDLVYPVYIEAADENPAPRKIHWIRIGAVAALAIAIGIGAYTMPRVEWSFFATPPVVDSTPVPSEYDIFRDPNVLWGTPEENYVRGEMIVHGRVFIGTELQKTIDFSNEDNLIAFIVAPQDKIYFRAPNFPISTEELVIHEEFDPDGVLTELLNRYIENGDWEDYLSVVDYTQNFTQRKCAPYHSIVFETINNIYSNLEKEHPYELYKGGTLTVFEWGDMLMAKALTLALQDESFAETYQQYKYYMGMEQNFWYSFMVQQINGYRKQMSQYGFIPVYSEEEVDPAQYADLPYVTYEHPTYKPGEAPIEKYEALMLRFVGTRDQIDRFIQAVTEEGTAGYYLWGSGDVEEMYTSSRLD